MAYVANIKLKKNSPHATLTGDINDSVTTIPVSNLEYFHDEDGTLIVQGIVIGYDNATETYPEEITITGASATSGAGNLTGATRGVNADGTNGAARSWSTGDKIAVMLSTGVYNRIKDNLVDHESSIGTLESGKISASTFNAKGDILSASADDTPSILSVGANGTVITPDDGETTGLKWVAPKQPILLHGSGGWASTTNPDDGFTQIELETNDVDIKGVSFESAAAAKYHQYHLRMPTNYDASTVTATFVWTTNDSTPSGDISWKIDAQAYGNDDPLDAAWGTAVEVVDTIIAQNDLHISSKSGAITIANTPAAGDWVAFRVYRDGADASDTSSNDVVLLGVYILYGTNSPTAG